MAVAVALKLTVDSNRIARQTQSLELRPWVLFAGFSNQFYNHFTFDDVERGKAAQFAIIIKNYGKVPAINAKVKINSAVVPKDFEGFPDLSLPLTGKAVIIGPETATETQPRYIFGDDHVGIFDFSKKVAIAVRCEYTGPRSTEIHKTIIKGFIYLFQVRGDTPTGGQAVFSWDNFSYEQT